LSLFSWKNTQNNYIYYLLEYKTKLLRKCCLKPVCMLKFKHRESYLLLQYNFFNPKPTGPDRCQIIKYTRSSNNTIKQHNWTFSFFRSQIVHNPMLYATIIILQLLPPLRLPAISSFSGIVNVTCFCLTAALCLLILQSSEAITIA